MVGSLGRLGRAEVNIGRTALSAVNALAKAAQFDIAATYQEERWIKGRSGSALLTFHFNQQPRCDQFTQFHCTPDTKVDRSYTQR